MKIIFLDIDGVLNCSTTKERLNGMPFVENTKIELLRELVEKTQSEIVLSSTWRLFPPDREELEFKLRRFGLSIYDVTPNLSSERGNEIQAWLNNNPDTESFVILDDDTDMGNLIPHLVQTTWKNGLEPKHIEQALKILT